MSAISIELPPDMLEQIARRVAELLVERDDLADLVLDRHADNGESGWLRGADQIATYIGAPRSRVYALASAGRIPIQKDGSALLARRGDLDAWVRSGGGKRP